VVKSLLEDLDQWLLSKTEQAILPSKLNLIGMFCEGRLQTGSDE
jgi:hypothetical protein